MAECGSFFYNLTFSKIKDYFGELVTKDDMEKEAGYCGVVHLCNVKVTESGDVDSAVVHLYIMPFETTNKEKVKTGFTDHRIMMTHLNLWEKFMKFKSRVCDDKGVRHRNWDVTKETELWYGFMKRPSGKWNSTSCTLNSWVIRIGKDASEVLRRLGIAGSDTVKMKADQINIMPHFLWKQVLRELEKLIPNGARWTLEWATRASATELAREEVNRMRGLVESLCVGSKQYSLDIGPVEIGGGGVASVKALADVLQEDRYKDNLRELTLSHTELNCEHMEHLAPAIAQCRKLEDMYIMNNKIADDGSIALAEVLPRLGNLKLLALTNNNIGDKGCFALIHALRERKRKYFSLFLDQNNIRQEAVQALKSKEFKNDSLSIYLE